MRNVLGSSLFAVILLFNPSAQFGPASRNELPVVAFSGVPDLGADSASGGEPAPPLTVLLGQQASIWQASGSGVFSLSQNSMAAGRNPFATRSSGPGRVAAHSTTQFSLKDGEVALKSLVAAGSPPLTALDLVGLGLANTTDFKNAITMSGLTYAGGNVTCQSVSEGTTSQTVVTIPTAPSGQSAYEYQIIATSEAAKFYVNGVVAELTSNIPKTPLSASFFASTDGTSATYPSLQIVQTEFAQLQQRQDY